MKFSAAIKQKLDAKLNAINDFDTFKDCVLEICEAYIGTGEQKYKTEVETLKKQYETATLLNVEKKPIKLGLFKKEVPQKNILGQHLEAAHQFKEYITDNKFGKQDLFKYLDKAHYNYRYKNPLVVEKSTTIIHNGFNMF